MKCEIDKAEVGSMQLVCKLTDYIIIIELACQNVLNRFGIVSTSSIVYPNIATTPYKIRQSRPPRPIEYGILITLNTSRYITRRNVVLFPVTTLLN